MNSMGDKTKTKIKTLALLSITDKSSRQACIRRHNTVIQLITSPAGHTNTDGCQQDMAASVATNGSESV